MARHFFPPELRLSDDAAFDSHGAAILFLIREGRVKNWTGLCRVFHFDPRENHSGHYALRRTLAELIRASLVLSKSGVLGPYTVSPRVEELLQALDCSLLELANMP